MPSYYGTNYNDYQVGSSYSDSIYGNAGNDTQYGSYGNDYLSGGSGNDYLNGGSGNDYLNGGSGYDVVYGGTGQDWLVGGNDYSRDDFRFYQGDSPSTNYGADTIADWNVSYDYIDMPIAGTAYNYAEAQTGWTSIEGARYQVEHSATLRQEDHVFLYNASTDTGYLLSDLDRNYTFETGVILRGAGSAWDLNYSDII
jgi:serralysin